MSNEKKSEECNDDLEEQIFSENGLPLETIKYVKNECGKHWGPNGGKCPKCACFNTPEYRKLQRDGCMHNGMPWISILGPPLETPGFWNLSQKENNESTEKRKKKKSKNPKM